MLAQLVTYESTVRGAAEDSNTSTRVSSATQTLALEVPLDDLPPLDRGEIIDIRVVAPSGGELAHLQRTLGELLSNRLFFVPIRTAEVEAGSYRAEFRYPQGDPVERHFRLRVAQP